MDLKYSLEISKILDKHLPANGVGTEREVLRIKIHRDFTDLVNELLIASVVGQSEQLKAFVEWWHGLSQEELVWYEGQIR